MGFEDHELDAELRHYVEGLEVDGGLGEPHAFRWPAEAVLEVADSPEDLGVFVPRVSEREDHVVVGLGHGGAVAGEASLALGVGGDDLLVHVWGFVLEPFEERGPEVVADASVVVSDLADPALFVKDARAGVGAVALGGDALVPVVVGMSGILELDGFEPGVLAGGLVEVAVDADVAIGHA